MRIKCHIEYLSNTALKDGAIRLATGVELLDLPISFDRMMNMSGNAGLAASDAATYKVRFNVQ